MGMPEEQQVFELPLPLDLLTSLGDIPITPTGLSVDYSYTPLNPRVGQGVGFESFVSGGTGPYNYSWSFGDGQTSIYQNPVWYPNSVGTFNVTLTVTDSQGRTGSRQKSITVSP